jgi:trehalose 6-phosphate phosphatase
VQNLNGIPTESNGLASPEPLADARVWAVFLDVDGTLVELAETPDQVRARPGLVTLLQDLRARLDGALALVSGRTIREVDEIFAPETFPTAGIHGAEIRMQAGDVQRIAADPQALDPVRRAFGRFAAMHDGTMVEDKHFAIALHYRRRPDLATAVEDLGEEVAATLGVDLDVLAGKMLVEVRVRAAHKGAAIETLLATAPFAGRRPVYVGDDVTDEDAFRTVNAREGTSIGVGRRAGTAARYAVPDVTAVYEWLRTSVATLKR